MASASRDIPNHEYWSQDNLDKCFLAVLKRLRSYLEDGFLPHYFTELNLIHDCTQEDRDKILKALDNERVLDIIYNPQYYPTEGEWEDEISRYLVK